VLYGTIPEFVKAEKRTHAFAVFYTGGSIAGAASPFLFGVLGDLIGLVPAMMGVGVLALLTVPLVWALRPAFSTEGPLLP
jgi:predicted MFS family arabinose efflux permease